MNEVTSLVTTEEPPESGHIIKAPITSAQAKIDAVANLTFKAYERASTLQPTSEEVAALQADFPDEAFQPGAAGKEHLIYIEHAHLRDRLNQVFNPGQWAIVPRNRWAEDFSTGKGTEASRVYVEAMLCIRGCFVSEAVGDMVYYKNNDSQNYGDAVEGAKTAALRRCAKELGIGLQAWKKSWTQGWWDRRNGKSRTAPKSSQAPERPQTSVKPQNATEKTRAWFLTELRKRFDDETLKRFFQLATLEDIPLESVPTTKPRLEEIAARILATVKTGESTPQSELADLITTAGFTFDLFQNLVIGLGALKQACGSFDELPEERAKWCLRNSKAILSGLIKSAPKEKPAEKSTDSDWSSFPMPWGKQAGTPLGELDEKYLYGLWANYEVETEYNGRPKKKETIEKDREFRAMLDHAGVHHEFEDRGFEKQD